MDERVVRVMNVREAEVTGDGEVKEIGDRAVCVKVEEISDRTGGDR